MRESVSNLRSDSDISAHRQLPSTPPRSYTAMVLSAILPGLGQIYLNQFVKGFIVFIVFTSAIGIFYINSYPVRGWSDLLRFKPTTQAGTSTDDNVSSETDTDSSIALWTLDDGKTLMFRPTWILKITSSIQALICWIYAVYGGWCGRREFSEHQFEID